MLLDEEDPEEINEEIDLKALKSNQNPISIIPSLLLHENEEEEEEDEEISSMEIATLMNVNQSEVEKVKPASSNFLESEQNIQTDPWDISSWSMYIEEAENNRSGNVLLTAAYEKYLSQFPRDSTTWVKYATHYLDKGDMVAAEDVFKRSLKFSNSIITWEAYLKLIKRRSVDKVSKYSDFFESEKKIMNNSFEKAIDAVGKSIRSSSIWRLYLDFALDWPEVVEADAANKLKTLREIYRNSLCTPMDNLEIIWKEYEHLEKKTSEQFAEQILPEYLEKYKFSRAIYDKRKAYAKMIDFEMVAIPPGNKLNELQQLEAWDKWIRYELTNPESSNVDAHKRYMQLLFSDALSCLRFYPEIWITYANFMSQVSTVQSAKDILRESIKTIPKSMVIFLIKFNIYTLYIYIYIQ